MNLSEFIIMLQKIKETYPMGDPIILVNGKEAFEIMTVTNIRKIPMVNGRSVTTIFDNKTAKEVRINN